ncbi:MAG: hypothetical protein NC097_04895 [Clostridium sp.]|nr:hypothetical protein [Prevotella sp.]MCM1429114.1 hypothetical protein [Clostridium sp.]MCM1475358.1 hypothetical protein [Muribaculaceae bacterium]
MMIQLLGAIGGLEAIKWLMNRKNASRIVRAQAMTEEQSALSAREKLYEDTILFLQQQLKEKEERFAQQTELLRQSTSSELELTRQLGQLELRLQRCRCDKFNCADRQPPLAQDTK